MGGLESLLGGLGLHLGGLGSLLGCLWAVLGLALSKSFAAVNHGLDLASSFAAVGHRFAFSNSFGAFRFQLLRFGGAGGGPKIMMFIDFHWFSLVFSIIFALGRSWVVLVALESLLGRLGAVLGALGALLGRSWAVLGLSWSPPGPLLELSWEILEPS